MGFFKTEVFASKVKDIIILNYRFSIAFFFAEVCMLFVHVVFFNYSDSQMFCCTLSDYRRADGELYSIASLRALFNQWLPGNLRAQKICKAADVDSDVV